ncbi:SDR family oxidoreductase [Propioniciclava soli]|uniref:SDR family oxidoreductase n=1 Tax=Propioniciclava soli TaxID=2775081 RepID=A0ABZ3C7Q7_9ACTN|nr:SDR family oxidoreductase [Propioniciclava soli]
MTVPIAVTGATGQLGGAVARRLSAAGVPLRLVVRTPARAPHLPGADVAQATFGDADAVRDSLTGVDVVLMVSAGESATRLEEHRTFVRAAAEAGVKHVVYTSFAAAAPDAVFTLGRDHFHTEAAIRDAGLGFTFLRDNFYADALPAFADADGVVRGPASEGRCAFVVRADVAEVAATVLRSAADHAGATYTLTGPESLTFADALAELGAATGRPYRFENETVEDAHASRRAQWPGEPDWQYDAWVSTYTAVASGALAEVTGDVPALLGRPAKSVAEFARTLAS